MDVFGGAGPLGRCEEMGKEVDWGRGVCVCGGGIKMLGGGQRTETRC